MLVKYLHCAFIVCFLSLYKFVSIFSQLCYCGFSLWLKRRWLKWQHWAQLYLNFECKSDNYNSAQFQPKTLNLSDQLVVMNVSSVYKLKSHRHMQQNKEGLKIKLRLSKGLSSKSIATRARISLARNLTLLALC